MSTELTLFQSGIFGLVILPNMEMAVKATSNLMCSGTFFADVARSGWTNSQAAAGEEVVLPKHPRKARDPDMVEGCF